MAGLVGREGADMNRRKITVTFEITDESPMSDTILASRLGNYIILARSAWGARINLDDLETAMGRLIRIATAYDVDPFSTVLTTDVSAKSEPPT